MDLTLRATKHCRQKKHVERQTNTLLVLVMLLLWNNLLIVFSKIHPNMANQSD